MKITVTEGLTVAKYLAIALVAYAAYRAVSKGVGTIGGFYQSVVDVGTGVIDAVTHPVDTAADMFGISPGLRADGTPKWEQTTPWDNLSSANDPVSNNDQGVNWNYF